MTDCKTRKNEQHCIKQNEKSFIQKDLSLTEQWEKGELLDDVVYDEYMSVFGTKSAQNLKTAL